MKKYKNQFAIEFAKVMQENLPQWKKLQKTHIKALFNNKVWNSLYLFNLFVGFILGTIEKDYSLNFEIVIIFIIFCIILNIYFENKEYQKDIKKDLFPKLLKVFGEKIEYGPGTKFGNSLGYIPNFVYNNSMLFDETVSYDSPDDTFTGIYKDSSFTILETEIINTIKHIGGNTEDVRLFKGVAMHIKMQKKIKPRVLIYSKGTFKNRPPKDFEKVEFEYEKFNKKYDVYVQKTPIDAVGQIESRYLFNTVFMDRFMQLHTSFRIRKMKCSICENYMLILLATNRDLFEINPIFGRIDDINQYKKLFDEISSVLLFLDVLNPSLSSKTGL